MKFLRPARPFGTRVLAVTFLLGVFFILNCGLASPAFASTGSPERSVQGRVIDSNQTPVPNAIVYLSNTRTMTVESYITQQDGAYRFEQISPDDNYKLWAQVDGKKSKVKTLSSFDDRSVFHVILKIDTGK